MHSCCGRSARARGRRPHGPRQHRQSRIRSGAQSRSHPRCRIDSANLRFARRAPEQIGIPYALLDGRFEAIPSTCRLLGAVAGEPGSRTRATQRLLRGLETGLGASIDRIRGAHNVTAERLAPVSIEQVLVWNPQVIVTIYRDFAANVCKDPGWAQVEAVRAGRVYLSPKLPLMGRLSALGEPADRPLVMIPSVPEMICWSRQRGLGWRSFRRSMGGALCTACDAPRATERRARQRACGSEAR